MSAINPAAPRSLRVTVRNVYGTETVYPACEQSQLLCELTGRRTLTPADIRTLRKLGFTFAIQETRAAPSALRAALSA